MGNGSRSRNEYELNSLYKVKFDVGMLPMKMIVIFLKRNVSSRHLRIALASPGDVHALTHNKFHLGHYGAPL